jgi:hypothetical protein
MVVALLALFAVSGSHRVHHLTDLESHSDHHTHHDQTQQSADCLFLFLMQHSPIVKAASVLPAVTLTLSERITFEFPRCFAQVFGYNFQARSPPVRHLFTTVLS